MNNVTKSNDNGAVISYEYDKSGRCVKVTQNSNEETETFYDVMGNVYATKNAKNQITLYTYDALGRLLSTADSISAGRTLTDNDIAENTELAKSIVYTYDNMGNKLTETNALGNANVYTYDNCGRVKTVTYPDGNSVSYDYDGCGNMTKMTDAKGFVTSYEYTGNRLTRTYDDISDIEGISYNEYGEIASKTDGEGNVTSYTYDPCGRLKAVTVNTDETTQYGYDKEGNKISMTDGNGNVTVYSYGNFNRLTAITDGEGNTESYGYDARGNLTRKIDGNGKEVIYGYDAKNNLTSLQYDDKIISYEYDKLNNRTKMSDESGVYVYTYDNGNRLTKVTKNGSDYLSYAYDKLGNTTNINGTAYTYDECSRMKTAGNVSYEYDKNGNLAKTTLPVGETTYTYDSRNRVIKVENKVSSSVLSSYSYSYYNNNLEKSKTDNSGEKISYEYDGAGRLIKVADGTRTAVYDYDKAGNRTVLTETALKTGTVGGSEITYAVKVSSYLYSDSNRLLSVSELYKNGENAEVMRKITRYVFDVAGNQISTAAEYLTPSSETPEEIGAASSGYESIVEVSVNEYNGLNQLINTTNIKDGERTFANYLYNGDGLRVQKTVDGTATDYVYSGNYVIAETGKTYLRGLSYHAVTKDDGIYYYFCNSHGDVTGIVNNSGATVATYDYDEFGNLTEETGDFDNDIKYAGEFFDSESENYYLRSRYYDPTVGRFTQQDSFLGVDNNPLSLNRYTYCHNNPIRFVDPSGFKIVEETVGGYKYTFDDDTIYSNEWASSGYFYWLEQFKQGNIDMISFYNECIYYGINISVIHSEFDINYNHAGEWWIETYIVDGDLHTDTIEYIEGFRTMNKSANGLGTETPTDRRAFRDRITAEGTLELEIVAPFDNTGVYYFLEAESGFTKMTGRVTIPEINDSKNGHNIYAIVGLNNFVYWGDGYSSINHDYGSVSLIENDVVSNYPAVNPTYNGLTASALYNGKTNENPNFNSEKEKSNDNQEYIGFYGSDNTHLEAGATYYFILEYDVDSNQVTFKLYDNANFGGENNTKTIFEADVQQPELGNPISENYFSLQSTIAMNSYSSQENSISVDAYGIIFSDVTLYDDAGNYYSFSDKIVQKYIIGPTRTSLDTIKENQLVINENVRQNSNVNIIN